jgi:hypothetical protein
MAELRYVDVSAPLSLKSLERAEIEALEPPAWWVCVSFVWFGGGAKGTGFVTFLGSWP